MSGQWAVGSGQSTVRVLPFACADGATNMAIDEVLLQSAQRGVATLRFYTWSQPTASLGYFQASSVLQEISWPDSLPWVRRPSGGMTLVHDHEITYALAVPAGFPLIQHPCMLGMHAVIHEALAQCGVGTTVESCGPEHQAGGPLCFLHLTPGDLRIGAHKVVGSAQRKQRGAVLQHGSILLKASELKPMLLGILDLCPGSDAGESAMRDRLLGCFRSLAAVELGDASLTEQEAHAAAHLVKDKYTQARWNAKR